MQDVCVCAPVIEAAAGLEWWWWWREEKNRKVWASVDPYTNDTWVPVGGEDNRELLGSIDFLPLSVGEWQRAPGQGPAWHGSSKESSQRRFNCCWVFQIPLGNVNCWLALLGSQEKPGQWRMWLSGGFPLHPYHHHHQRLQKEALMYCVNNVLKACLALPKQRSVLIEDTSASLWVWPGGLPGRASWASTGEEWKTWAILIDPLLLHMILSNHSNTCPYSVRYVILSRSHLRRLEENSCSLIALLDRKSNRVLL